MSHPPHWCFPSFSWTVLERPYDVSPRPHKWVELPLSNVFWTIQIIMKPYTGSCFCIIGASLPIALSWDLRLSCTMECLPIIIHFHWTSPNKSQYSRPKPQYVQDCMSHVATCCSFTKCQTWWYLLSQIISPSQTYSLPVFILPSSPHISQRDPPQR